MDSPEDFFHSYVEYPYNSDGRGNDLPLVIGTFRVPSLHERVESTTERMQVGYVRYLTEATENANAALVILSDGRAESTTRRDTYAQIRQAMDVVVFHRRGFGLSAPPVDCGLFRYPLNQPLLIQRLREAATRYADRCAERYETANLTTAALADAEVAHDLYDLSRVIGKDRFYLLLGRSMAGVGFEAARRYPRLIAGVILMNPDLSAEELSTIYWADRPESDMDLVDLRLLQQQLPNDGILVQAATRSGTPATIAIGPLDLAFAVSSYRRSGNNIEELLAAARKALDGHYDALGTIMLEMRKNLGSPGNTILIARANQMHRQSYDAGNIRHFAVDWPSSAFPHGAAAVDLNYGDLEIPVLVLQSSGEVCEHDRGSKLDDDGNKKAARVYVTNGSSRLLDESAAVSAITRNFIAGKELSRTCI